MGYSLLLLAQLGLFYGLPAITGPGNEIGMVVLMLGGTWVLSLLLGAFSGRKIRFFYPILPALLFLPSIPLFYDSSALIHSLWYFIVALIGVDFGAGLRALGKLAEKKGDTDPEGKQ